MLQRFVANWLRQHAQETLLQGLRPSDGSETQDELPAGDAEPVDVACFFPNTNQAAGLADLMASPSRTRCHGFVEQVGTAANRRIALIETSLPHEQLALVVRDVIALRKPSWILACGFATALVPALRRGHLLVANRLVDRAGYSLSIDSKMTVSKGLHVGTLLTVDESLATADANSGELPAHAVAQETQAAVIGEVCRVLKTKMMAVHCVSAIQGAGENIVTKNIKSQDSIAGIVGAAAGALIEQPSSIKGMWRDKEASLVFADRLAKFLVSVITQLPKDR